ncbi:hypothetical protein HJFPF1_03074 [Paramyrothecium foliicola]|nr:hypothetical protein HJFPF1_03074 [Paramyrothecium foliicola]
MATVMAACPSKWLPGRRAPWRQLFSYARRTYSAGNATSSTRFTYVLPQHSKIRREELFEKLKGHAILSNHAAHNAAVILVTPDFAQHLDDEAFVCGIAQLMSGSSQNPEFHLLAAVVDHVAPLLGAHQPLSGISALRGHLDEILPELWTEAPPRTKEDDDAVAAIAFELGLPSVTLPLTRTTFINSRPSTLISRLIDTSGPKARIIRQAEKHSQRVRVFSPRYAQSVGDLGLYAPLAPVTRPRIVTGSFGNIVKAIEVDGQSIPASTELENAVNSAYQRLSSASSSPKPVGIWALVAPVSFSATREGSLGQAGLQSPLALDEAVDIRKLAQSTAQELEELYKQGGRLYKILSGGGGWGAKKGLLSLDPQQTHFSLSEEEEMERFMRTMEDDSGFAPPGSAIQFLTSVGATSDAKGQFEPGAVFGVPGDITPAAAELEEGGNFIGQHFGALSNEGVFISGPEFHDASHAGSPMESKLTVPHSRVYLMDRTGTEGSSMSWASGLAADAGTAALVM